MPLTDEGTAQLLVFVLKVTSTVPVLTVLAASVFRYDATALSFATVRWRGVRTHTSVSTFEWSAVWIARVQIPRAAVDGGSSRLPWTPIPRRRFHRGGLWPCHRIFQPKTLGTLADAPESFAKKGGDHEGLCPTSIPFAVAHGGG
jgi:hypothetical protein